MARDPIPTWTFALTVVRLGDTFLLVREREHGEKWYLPAGRVEPGERIADAAVREALEESGVRIALDGVLQVQHTVRPGGTARLRVIFLGHAVSGTPGPTSDSLDARWVTAAELEELELRDEEVRTWIAWADGAVAPLSILGTEDD